MFYTKIRNKKGFNSLTHIPKQKGPEDERIFDLWPQRIEDWSEN